jgi:hypothetical protein
MPFTLVTRRHPGGPVLSRVRSVTLVVVDPPCQAPLLSQLLRQLTCSSSLQPGHSPAAPTGYRSFPSTTQSGSAATRNISPIHWLSSLASKE